MQRSQKQHRNGWYRLKKDIGIQIVCPNCRSNNYRNTGKSQGRQKHQCNDCGRYFVENPKPGTYLEVSEDVWLASDLGFCLDKQSLEVN